MGARSIDAREEVRLAPVRNGDPRATPVLVHAEVESNRRIAPDYWSIKLEAPEIAERAKPGQFVMLTLARQHEAMPILPRPMAIYSWAEAGTIEIVYKVVGEGTRVLSGWRPGEVMTSVGPLGVPFQLRPDTNRILLLGRGIGTCSLTALAQHAVRRGVAVYAVASGRTRESIVGVDFYRSVGASGVFPVSDADGSSDPPAIRDNVSRVLGPRLDQIFVCGSERLLNLASRIAADVGADVQVSIEAHMACGLGYCHGCSSGAPGLAAESPLVCAEGPVFFASSATRKQRG